MINKAVLFVFKTAYGTTVSQSKFHLKLVACIIWTDKVLSGFLKGFIYFFIEQHAVLKRTFLLLLLFMKLLMHLRNLQSIFTSE